MRDYEEKSYYEIQLDNKQLILVFLAGVTVCVLIFVLGVLVGKGKKEAEMAAVKTETPVPVKPQEDTQPPSEAKPIVENKQSSQKSAVKTEPKEKKDEDYSFYDLDKSESESKLTKKVESKTPATETKTPPPQEKPKPAEKAKPVAESTVPVASSKEVKEAKEEAEVSTPAGSQRYTVQVMATASKSKAEQRLNELIAKGYPAYMDEGTGTGSSVYKVRIGKYADSASAKKDAVKLKEELNLDTWVAVLD